MDLFRLLKKLVTIESVSGNEQEVVAFVEGYLKRIGYHVMLQEVKDGRRNIFAYIEEPYIVFTTHLDTVNPYLPFHEDTGYIYGRGSCDAKGVAAVQIKAAEELAGTGLKNIGLLFVVGEEWGSDGAAAANTIPNSCQWFINGEPTENTLVSGSKGAIRIKVEATGTAAHSAYPQQGDSAVLTLLHLLNKWETMAFPCDDVLGDTTMNIGTIAGGVQANVIPDHAQAEIMFRTVVSFEKMKFMLEKDLPANIHMEYQYTADPVYMHTVDGFDSCVVSFATDVPVLSNWGRPLLLGPGSILDAHTDHEKVKKSDLVEAKDMYVKLAHILGEKNGM